MTSSSPSFNLVREPWVPVETNVGVLEEWSLARVFRDGHMAKGLGAVSPPEYVVLMRFLLAVAHRGLMGPATGHEWIDLWQKRETGFSDDRINQYLAKWEHRFDLFDRGEPFGQNLEFPRDLRKPVQKIVFERATSYDTLFEPPPMTSLAPAQAARGLLCALGFGVGTGSGLKYEGTKRSFARGHLHNIFSVFCEGDSLFESLILNMLRYDRTHPRGLSANDDAPFWEHENQAFDCFEKRPIKGLTDLYTWRGRKILLLFDDTGQTSEVRYEPGLEPIMGEHSDIDPFFHYEEKSEGFAPKSFEPGRALWRDSAAILEYPGLSNSRSRPPRVVTDLSDRVSDNPNELSSLTKQIVAVGTSIGEREAVVRAWRTDRLPVPLILLADSERNAILTRAVVLAESAWENVLYPSARRFAQIGLRLPDDYRPKKSEIDKRVAILQRMGVSDMYWGALDSRFQRFLSELGVTRDPNNLLEEWKMTLRYHCEDTFRVGCRRLILTGGNWGRAATQSGYMLLSRLSSQGFALGGENMEERYAEPERI